MANTKKTKPTSSSTDLTPDELHALRVWVRLWVRGPAPLDNLLEEAPEYLKPTRLPEGIAEQLLAEEMLALAAEEKSWPKRTDNDLLDDAFASMRKKGILAEQDFWCCQNCGHAAATEEVKKSKGKWKGYVFFHQQDTEGAIDGEGLFLAFGTGKPDEKADVAIAKEAVYEIAKKGLDVAWDGTVTRRPFVEMTWRKRRFT